MSSFRDGVVSDINQQLLSVEYTDAIHATPEPKPPQFKSPTREPPRRMGAFVEDEHGEASQETLDRWAADVMPSEEGGPKGGAADSRDGGAESKNHEKTPEAYPYTFEAGDRWQGRLVMPSEQTAPPKAPPEEAPPEEAPETFEASDVESERVIRKRPAAKPEVEQEAEEVPEPRGSKKKKDAKKEPEMEQPKVGKKPAKKEPEMEQPKGDKHAEKEIQPKDFKWEEDKESGGRVSTHGDWKAWAVRYCTAYRM